MKKKILFVNTNLETGGIQTSLINLLKEIKDDYDVTLLLFYYTEDQLKVLPEGVKVLKVKSPFKHFGMYSRDAKAKPFTFLSRAFFATVIKFFGRPFAVKLMLPFQKKIRGFDCAISFTHEARPKRLYGGCNDFVLKKTDAELKIGWIHGDFGRCGADIEQSLKIYRQFDKIVACSDGARKAFVACMPELKNKTVGIRNCNDFEAIKLKSQPKFQYPEGCFNIVTVARLFPEKALDRAVTAIKAVKDKGFAVKYHLVGDGPETDKLKELAESYGIADDIVFYGNKENPYPFIAAADLFLLTSYHEAAPMVFDEAACLGVPVLATETTSTYEMLEQPGFGVVCKNEQQDITDKLLYLVSNPQELEIIRKTLADKTFNNHQSAEKLRNILLQKECEETKKCRVEEF